MSRSQGAHRERQPIPLLSVVIADEPDVVVARQRARQLARLLDFQHQDQIRFATATSEIARNAFQYAGGGKVEFYVQPGAGRDQLAVRISDNGPGISELGDIRSGRYHSHSGMGVGLSGTGRLMEFLDIDSKPGLGATVTFGKTIPLPTSSQGRVSSDQLARIGEELAREGPRDAYEELQRQNQELLTALEVVRRQEETLRQKQEEFARLNQELEQTNRGVVALYAELDERADALRQANEIKSRFLSHMSHEFRTPLNSILALTGLLDRRVDGDLTPDQHKQVNFIRRAAEELFEMVNDLLDLAKVEAGKVELHHAPVDVGHLLGALRGMLRPLVTNDHVTLVVEEPVRPIWFVSDEGKVAQILRNLVSNALKFTERGEVRVSVDLTGNQLRFLVSDTGIGVAPADHERIFKDFAQVDHPIQRKVKGTGLGLPLSRKLSGLLGGTLTVESTVGKGSVFTLALPAEQVLTTPGDLEAGHGSALAQPSLETLEPAEEAGTILVIDDEEIARYLIRQLFRGTRYRLIEASGGIEGAERARFEKPQLILLDLSMPDRSGFEVFDELKSDPATSSIPIMIHTSRTLRTQDLERLGGRHAGVLTKDPLHRDEALWLLRELLDEPNLFTMTTAGPA